MSLQFETGGGRFFEVSFFFCPHCIALVPPTPMQASLIRINPREPEIPSHAQVMLSDTYGAVRGLDRGIELPLNSLEALRKIDHAMRK